MPAKSQAQQRLMGMVHAYKKGKLPNASEQVRSLARRIEDTDAGDFARTKHDGLPSRKEAATRLMINAAILQRYGLLKTSCVDLRAFEKRANFAINCALLTRAGLLKASAGMPGLGGSDGMSSPAGGVGGQAGGQGGDLGVFSQTTDARRGGGSARVRRGAMSQLTRRLRTGGVGPLSTAKHPVVNV